MGVKGCGRSSSSRCVCVLDWWLSESLLLLVNLIWIMCQMALRSSREREMARRAREGRRWSDEAKKVTRRMKTATMKTNRLLRALCEKREIGTACEYHRYITEECERSSA